MMAENQSYEYFSRQGTIANTFIAVVFFYYFFSTFVPWMRGWMTVRREKEVALQRIRDNSEALARETKELEEQLLEMAKVKRHEKGATQFPAKLKPVVFAAPEPIPPAPTSLTPDSKQLEEVIGRPSVRPAPVAATRGAASASVAKARSVETRSASSDVSALSPAEEFRRLLREEQDMAFAASELKDRARFEARAADNSAPANADKQLAEKRRMRMRELVAPEPALDHPSSEVITIQFRVSGFGPATPGAGVGVGVGVLRVMRRFLLNQTTDEVVAFITSHDAIPLDAMSNVAILTTTVIVGSSTTVQAGYGLRAFSSGNLILLVRPKE